MATQKDFQKNLDLKTEILKAIHLDSHLDSHLEIQTEILTDSHLVTLRDFLMVTQMENQNLKVKVMDFPMDSLKGFHWVIHLDFQNLMGTMKETLRETQKGSQNLMVIKKDFLMVILMVTQMDFQKVTLN